MIKTITQCGINFGEAPRRFSIWDRFKYFHIPRPEWLALNLLDNMRTHFNIVSSVFTNGLVTWGCVIQANELLFEHGNDDCPGDLVYSLEDPESIDPAHLESVAHSLYSLKGTSQINRELQCIADYLADEHIRVFGVPVPTRISKSPSYKISTTFFVRKHLPNRRLCSRLMPIVVNRHEPYVVTPLPERYWPPELKAWWQQ